MGGWLIITEGIPDALVAAQAGYRSIGVLGSTYPDRELARRISQGALAVGAPRVVVCFDVDEAGRTGSSRLVDLLNACGVEEVVEVVPPAGLDLSDWATNGNAMLRALRSVTMLDLGTVTTSHPSPGIDL